RATLCTRTAQEAVPQAGPCAAAPPARSLRRTALAVAGRLRATVLAAAGPVRLGGARRPDPPLRLRRLAMRRLQPEESLDDDAILRRGLAPGASAVLLLEVEDPGDKAVAFEFGFE